MLVNFRRPNGLNCVLTSLWLSVGHGGELEFHRSRALLHLPALKSKGDHFKFLFAALLFPAKMSFALEMEFECEFLIFFLIRLPDKFKVQWNVFDDVPGGEGCKGFKYQ